MIARFDLCERRRFARRIEVNATLLASFALSALLCTAPVQSARAGETLRIGTLNCEFLIRGKTHLKYGLPFSRDDWTEAQAEEWSDARLREQRFAKATAAVAQVVHEINADVLGLVEVGDERDVRQLQAAVRELGLDYPYMTVGDLHDQTTEQRVAVLSRHPLSQIETTIPGGEFYDVEEDDPESEREARVDKGMHVVFEAVGQKIHFYVVHLKSERLGHESDMQRVAQASIVRRNYLQYLRAGEHVIVAGDLNDHPGQPALRRIRGRDDLESDLIQTGHPWYFPRDKEDSRWTYQFRGARYQLDHVLPSLSLRDACLPNGIHCETIPTTATIGDTSLPATDHRGFVVTFSFR
jgi:endonuclease/exonuclease/phosphatase family metal-dependent hydrolase